MKKQSSEALTGAFFILSGGVNLHWFPPDPAFVAGTIRGRLPSGKYLLEIVYPQVQPHEKARAITEDDLFLNGFVYFDEGDWRRQCAIEVKHAEEAAKTKADSDSRLAAINGAAAEAVTMKVDPRRSNTYPNSAAAEEHQS